MKKIIVADDEARIRRLVCDFLKKEGYEPLEADDGDVALEIFQKNPDTALLIVDIMMPNMDGWALCREIRKTSGVPIIMLTARSQEFDELMGFEAGADDYVTKPFSVNELLSRIKANIRRSSGEIVTSAAGETASVIEIRGLKIDTSHYSVELNGKQIDDITKKDYEILVLLAKNPGKVFTFEEICSKVWGYDFCGEDEKQTVTTAVHRLRAKLESDSQNPEYVHNKRGVGYYLK